MNKEKKDNGRIICFYLRTPFQLQSLHAATSSNIILNEYVEWTR